MSVNRKLDFDEYTYILINASYGGFGLSKEARELYNQKSPDKKLYVEKEEAHDGGKIFDWELPRHDPLLVQVFMELGSERSSGEYCRLKCVRILKKYQDYYTINEYDGREGYTIREHEYLLDNIKRVLDAAPEAPAENKLQEIRNIMTDFRKSLF